MLQVSDGAVVRRSAASMLSGKKPVQTVVSIIHCKFVIYNMCFVFIFSL